MYEFVTGPLVWLSFVIFFVGLIVRTVSYIRGLDWKLDRVTYSVNTSFGVRGAVRSILFWLFPYGTRSWRNNPWFTLWVFIFAGAQRSDAREIGIWPLVIARGAGGCPDNSGDRCGHFFNPAPHCTA